MLHRNSRNRSVPSSSKELKDFELMTETCLSMSREQTAFLIRLCPNITLSLLRRIVTQVIPSRTQSNGTRAACEFNAVNVLFKAVAPIGSRMRYEELPKMIA